VLKAGEFIKDVEAGSRSSALAGAIVALSHSLEIQTVAEGIETAEQAERMRSLGCTFGQGYFFSKPVAADEIVSGLDPAGLRRAVADAEPPARSVVARRAYSVRTWDVRPRWTRLRPDDRRGQFPGALFVEHQTAANGSAPGLRVPGPPDPHCSRRTPERGRTPVGAPARSSSPPRAPR
jgi:hypothetical protein